MDRIERAIAKKMNSLLNAQGFELKKEWNSFMRPQPYGYDRLMVVNMGTANPGPKHFVISIHFSIRHDAIEVPWNTLGLVYGEGQLETSTLVFGFPRGRAAPSLKVMPETMDEDVTRIAAEGEALFRDKGLTFFAQFADLAAIEQLANTRPLMDIDPYTVGGPMEHRAMRSLLLAKVVNPVRYAEVRETFIRLDKGMFPREKRLEMLKQVDEMVLP